MSHLNATGEKGIAQYEKLAGVITLADAMGPCPYAAGTPEKVKWMELRFGFEGELFLDDDGKQPTGDKR